jgi:hypothetical protein
MLIDANFRVARAEGGTAEGAGIVQRRCGLQRGVDAVRGF